jgi:hypothetical protein
MIVIHFPNVSTIYSRVVISSPNKWLENLLFAILYTFFGVWPRDQYMLLQRFTTGVCHALLQFPWPWALIAVLRFPLTSGPSCTMWIQIMFYAFPHVTEQDSQPIASLISKQVISYWTCGDTCYPRVSTPKTRSLADSSNHILWWT